MATRLGQVSEPMPTQTERLEKRHLDEHTRHHGLSEHYHVRRPERSGGKLATADELTDWAILPEPGAV